MGINGCIEFLIALMLNEPKLKHRTRKPSTTAQLQVRLGVALDPETGNEAPVCLNGDDLKRSIYLLGATGSGKTNIFLTIFSALVLASRTVLLIDPEGDLADRCVAYLAWLHEEALKLGDDAAGGRSLLDRLTLIDYRQSAFIAPFNPLAGSGEPASRALQVLRMIKEHSPSWGVQIEECFLAILIALATYGGTLGDVERLLYDSEFRARVVATVTDPTVRGFFERYENLHTKETWTQPVLNKLSFFAVPHLRLTFSSPNSVPLGTLLNTPGEIVIVSLASSHLYEAAHFIGGLWVSAAEQVIMARGAIPEEARNPTTILADEFSALAKEKFTNLLVQSRRFKGACVIGHQSIAQVPRDLSTIILSSSPLAIYMQMGATDASQVAREIVSDIPSEELRTNLMSQAVGQGFVARRAQPPIQVTFDQVIDPKVSNTAVAEIREQGLLRFGISRAEIESGSGAVRTVKPVTATTRRTQHETRPGPL